MLVEPEVVLERDGGEGLHLVPDPHAFLGLERLMEPFREPPPGHQPAGEFVDDQDLAVLDHVLDVLLVERIGPDQLMNAVDALGALGVLAIELLALLHPLLGIDLVIGLDPLQLDRQIREHEEGGVVRRHELSPLLREIGDVVLLVDDVEQLLVHFLHPLVAQELELDPLREPLERRLLGVDLEEPLVLGRAALHRQELDPDLPVAIGCRLPALPIVRRRFLLGRLGRRRSDSFLGLVVVVVVVLAFAAVGRVPHLTGSRQLLDLGQERVHELRLLTGDPIDRRLQVVVLLNALLNRPRNDERGARLVDEHRVHFVDDRERVPALHLFLEAHRHVVPEVVEAELVVGAVGHVAGVGGPPRRRRHVVLDHPQGQPEIAQDLPHPLRVAPGEVVVDRDQMNALPGQGVQIERHDGDQGLPLAGRHFGDLALMEDGSAHQLDVEGDHVPADVLIADLPGLPDVAAAGLLDDRVGFRQQVVEGLAAPRAATGTRPSCP